MSETDFTAILPDYQGLMLPVLLDRLSRLLAGLRASGRRGGLWLA